MPRDPLILQGPKKCRKVCPINADFFSEDNASPHHAGGHERQEMPTTSKESYFGMKQESQEERAQRVC